MTIRKVQVLVVGGGPVGMTVAMDLHSRGIEVALIERRISTDPWSARCNHVSASTMEVFRRLGVADKVRVTGLPDDHPTDVSWSTRLNGYEIARVPLASRAGRFTDRTAVDANWSTPEPPHRANQLYIDPVLQERLREVGVPQIEGTRLISFREEVNSIFALVSPTDGSGDHEIQCDYLVGCDGARSTVRRLIGAKMSGDDHLFSCRTAFITAPWLPEHIKAPPAWMYHFVGPGPIGVLMPLNGKEHWLVHVWGRPNERIPDDPDGSELQSRIRALLAAPDHLQWETTHIEKWTGRRLIADKFRKGRAFICGDAAHIWPPFAGFGMNCGIADGVNLAWILAAAVNGWGGPRLLDCYEAERQPVTDQVSRLAMDKVISYMAAHREEMRLHEFDRDDGVGDDARARGQRHLLSVHAKQYIAAGLNFGAFYDKSPAIAYDGEAAPRYSMDSYTPSTVPGCRVPHFWLPSGESLYDLLGPGYTLLRFDRSVDVSSLLAAAKRKSVPLKVVELWNRHSDIIRHSLLLVRPDYYVAWRGDEVPEDPDALADLVRGAGAGPEQVSTKRIL
jgi:2-polyprenyl-6-methoxyphenol hydroxylase-like FAD-dependent oxidoreductase